MCLPIIEGFACFGYTVAETRDVNWESGGRCRESLGGGTEKVPAFVGPGTGQCLRLVVTGGAAAFIGLGTTDQCFVVKAGFRYLIGAGRAAGSWCRS